ncbi:WD repeat-containing protein 44 [Linum perenne]
MNKPIHKQPVFGEDDDDAADQFYESLDRIATSSSCSTSNSDDSDPDPPQFSNYDLWISEPSSVSERRRTLLRHMGLSYDSSLSRSLVPPHFNFTPPHHSHHFPPHPFLTSNIPAVSRSKSDRRLDRRDDDYHPASPVAACNHDFNSSSSSSSFLSVYSSSILLSDDSITVNSLNNNHSDKAVVVANSKKNASVVSASKHTNLSSSPKFSATDAAAAASPSKPPSGKHGRSMDVTRSFSNTSIGGELMEGGSDCHGDDTSAVELTQACTIKNLDTGKEFVVNEIREDGMWNKLKEVGTGRQLTMEEFEMTVGHSPIVQELMRRQNVEDGSRENHESNCNGGTGAGGPKLKKKGGWLRSIKNVASSVKGHKERRSSDEKDTGSERGGRRSSSATDDSQDASFHGPERVRVKQYGKSSKELTAVYKSQETQAHTGSIWAIKFSLDGRYLASAGEDCVIHVWQVVEAERKGELLLEKQEDANFNLLVTVNGSPEPVFLSTSADGHNEKRRRGRSSLSRKSLSLEHIIVPETVFALTDKPICSFEGHIDDVLDLSWSKSQHLLSSSMDKTVRLWHLSSKTCLKIFSHSDYENKLQQKCQINLQNKKKKSHLKKITGFQFVPGSSSEVLITSADSRIRVIDRTDLVHKFKGFRNTNSQMSSSVTANGKFVVSASEDSYVYVWKHEADSRLTRSKGVTVTRSYEHFHCQDVSAAIPWPGIGETWGHAETCWGLPNGGDSHADEVSIANHPPTPAEEVSGGCDRSRTLSGCSSSPLNGIISSATNGYFFDRISATWPEEKLNIAARNRSPRTSMDVSNGLINQNVSAYGMVIVTAGLRGEIRAYQNFGLPVRI